MSGEPDYDDPAVEEAWCNLQRENVRSYLSGQGVDHGEIGEWPAFHFVPYVSVWAIESGRYPGRMGWWVISGDFPTDYFSFSQEVDHPRKVLTAAADRWDMILDNVVNGRTQGDISIRGLESNPGLQDMLRGRSASFREIVADDEMWADFDRES